jgi:hypothetical protein
MLSIRKRSQFTAFVCRLKLRLLSAASNDKVYRTKDKKKEHERYE